MKTYLLCFLVLTVVALAGCASVDIHDAVAVSKNVIVNRDDFKKVAQYRAPTINLGSGDAAYLRAFEPTSDTLKAHISPTVQLVVGLKAFHWVFYDKAYDSDGQSLSTVVLDRAVNMCSQYICNHTEIIAVTLPQGYLSAHASGLRIQVSGKGGNYVVQVPAAYIEGFLAAMPSAK